MAQDEMKKDLKELASLDHDKDMAFGPTHKDEEDTKDYYDYEYGDDYEDDDFYDFSKSEESSAGACTSLVLGVIASLGWIIPIIGFPITIVGTVLGAINMKNRKSKGLAIAGFIINIVFLCASIAKGIVDTVKYTKHH